MFKKLQNRLNKQYRQKTNTNYLVLTRWTTQQRPVTSAAARQPEFVNLLRSPGIDSLESIPELEFLNNLWGLGTE
jgi:hypothetical protein